MRALIPPNLLGHPRATQDEDAALGHAEGEAKRADDDRRRGRLLYAYS